VIVLGGHEVREDHRCRQRLAHMLLGRLRP
jgi:hypothetical protein